MKLAITVVYVVSDENEWLLDLHLAQIEKNTPEPYLIYAGANRSAGRVGETLARKPNVRVCEMPSTESRGGEEHAFYLDRLVARAIEDGATHVCTLHLDSFPIRPGWATDVAGRLTGACVLAGMLRDPLYDRKPMTAFMMFTREFYLAHRPTFLLSEEERASAEYRRYLKLHRNAGDSGVGYGYKIFSQGLSWIPLDRTDRGPGGTSFGIFGDIVFHLGGAVFWLQSGATATRATAPVRLVDAVDRRLGRSLRAVIPHALWVRLSRPLPQRFRDDFSVWRMRSRQSALAADPEGFLRSLRQCERR